MGLDHQRANGRAGEDRPPRQVLRGQHQHRPGQQTRLRMACGEQRARIGDGQRPQPRKGTDARPGPQAPGDRYPRDPGERERQHAERRGDEEKRRRIDESEPAFAAGAGLYPLLRGKVVGRRGRAFGGHLARTPEGKEIGPGGAHRLEIGIGQQREAGERQQQRIAAHPLTGQPVRPAQPVHRRLPLHRVSSRPR